MERRDTWQRCDRPSPPPRPPPFLNRCLHHSPTTLAALPSLGFFSTARYTVANCAHVAGGGVETAASRRNAYSTHLTRPQLLLQLPVHGKGEALRLHAAIAARLAAWRG